MVAPHPIAKLANPSPGHARLGPSSAKRWLACPGSIVLEADFPNASSKCADEGTACHDIAARCLIGNLRAVVFVGEYVAVNSKNEPRRTVLFDDDMAELVQQYVNNINALLKRDTVFWVETKVDISSWLGVPQQFGTADVATLDVYIGPDAQEGDLELCVHDAKFGRTLVEIDTPQLPLYALGFVSALVSGEPPPAVVRVQRARRAVIASAIDGIDDADLY